MELFSIRNIRLHNQLLTKKPYSEPADVISHLGAIQAQDYGGAKWSIGMRMDNANDDIIENALINKTIVRTWLMRGTLFFVNSADLRWIQQLVAPKIIASLKRRHAELELDTTTLIRTNTIITESLAKAPLLSRTALMSIIQQHGISTEGQRAAHILNYASLNGLICQTNSVKSIPNYILAERIEVPHSTLTKPEAIAELTRRYFTSRGPATISDFAWWSGLTIKEIKAGIEAHKSTLVGETYEAQTYWFNPDLVPVNPKPSALLLPGFDEFLLGYKDRSASLESQFSTYWCPGNNGMFMPFVVKDGEVIGTWKRQKNKSKAELTINYFKPASKLSSTAYKNAAAKWDGFRLNTQ
jgi:hypothetical protein